MGSHWEAVLTGQQTAISLVLSSMRGEEILRLLQQYRILWSCLKEESKGPCQGCYGGIS